MAVTLRTGSAAAILAMGLLLSACGSNDKNETTGLPIANVAPVANAGSTQSVSTGSTVTLDASASTDANADSLTYKWTLVSVPTGSTAALSSATAVKPTFVADVAGSYVFSLVVNDGTVDSPSVNVTVTAAAANVAPVANAGTAQNVTAGTLVTLDGSASSDANPGDTLTYAWTLTTRPGGSSAALSSATDAKPTFTADVAGTYVASLTVSDGKLSSTTATVTITAAAANVAPVANAGTAQNVTTGTLVTLDGSASSDANGDTLTYTWSLNSKPAGSAATLSNTAAIKPTFTADTAGDYVAQLIVYDGKVTSTAATVTITAAVANVAPVANAGTAQNVTTGTLVTLDGSASSDANGDTLTYAWTLTSKPSGSSAALSSSTAAKPTFTADVAGTYAFSLKVNDGKVDSTAATVSVTAAAANVAPVANAGSAQNVTTGTLVTLDGSASSDANGDTLTYAWTLTGKPAGSTAALSSSTAAKPTFTADLAGTYAFSLKVNDGKVDSAAATVSVTAAAANVAPVANAGSAQNVTTGTLVTLDGSASSDANGDTLTYAWSMTSKPSGSTAALSAGNVVKPTFTADVAGNYVFSLKVNDGQVDSTAATVTITAAVANVAPVANAGSAQNVTTGTLVTLDGTGSSDANGDTLSYAWTLTSTPSGSTATLSSSTAAKPTFTADVAGNYVAQLVVNDGALNSNTASVTITAAVGNVAPVANAGSAQNVTTGTLVTLDGTGSSDANGDTLSYAWTLTSTPSGSTAVLSSGTAAKPTFTADLAGSYVAQLVVNDGALNSNTASVTVTATATNTAPIANAGSDQSVSVGTQVTLDGSASSDADSDPLTYTWSFVSVPSGSSAALSSTSAQKPTFTPDVTGDYNLSLVVNDGKVNSTVATMKVTATAAVPQFTYSTNQMGTGFSAASGSATQTGRSVSMTSVSGKFQSGSDAYSFDSVDVTGDFTLTATVSALSANITASSSNQFRLGVMLCDCANGSATVGPMYAQSSLSATATAGTYNPFYAHRLTSAGSVGKATIGTATAVSPSSNLIFKLVRVGNTYTASYSSNGGASWTAATTQTFTGTLPNTVKAGVFAASGVSSAGVTITFDNITITQP